MDVENLNPFLEENELGVLKTCRVFNLSKLLVKGLKYKQLNANLKLVNLLQ